jgi:enoyl-CoA hydratase/carnithine racemase
MIAQPKNPHRRTADRMPCAATTPEIDMTDGTDTSSTPVLTIDGARATLRLNRPQHLNRLQPDDLASLLQSFDRIADEPSVRVLVLTGTGRAFSAGFDLGKVAERAACEDLAIPTICRVNGGVYGGSTDLALACDFRIGVDTAEMFMPAARLGLHYYPGGIKRYVTRLGVNNAKRLFLTAQKLDAAEMLRIGYLTAVVPMDRLDNEVDALAKILAANAPMAMAGMKRAINEFARHAFDEEAADTRARASMRGPEIKEGIAAFEQKRAPRF